MYLNWSNFLISGDYKNIPEDEKGLYILAVKFGYHYAPIYIGIAYKKRLRERIREHFYDSEQNEDLKKTIEKNKGNIYISYAISKENEDTLERMEKFLIDYHEPNCNREEDPIKNKSPLECNSPKDLL